MSARDKREIDKLLQPTILPDPVDWITSHFYIPETKAPITLAPYQIVCLREALSHDERGLYRYSTIVWSDIKKSAKTTIAAAVAMWVAFHKSHARIRLVGNDLKQADSRVFNAMTEAIKLNPEWRKTLKVIQHKIVFPNDSIIESVPVDPAGEAGGNDDMIEWTELWAAQHDVHKKMWSELTLSPTKFGQSFRWVDTYAGYTGESEILESLYQQATENNQPLDVGIPRLEVYATNRLFVLWNTKPRLDWQTKEYYAQEETNLDTSEFSRMHCNQWITSTEAFVPSEWWDSCYNEMVTLRRDDSIVIALDAGISDDCFGMAGVKREGGKTQAAYARKWEPPKNGKLDFAGPETELERLTKEYRVLEITYDPYQLHDFATRLRKKLHVPFQEFSQQQERLIADKQLKDMIKDGTIQHNGNADLTEHVKNANAKKEGEKLRIVKRSHKMKIDLAVALSMANHRAVELNPETGSFVMSTRKKY